MSPSRSARRTWWSGSSGCSRGGAQILTGTVTLRNRSNPKADPLAIRVCRSFLCRLRGLMFEPTMPPDWGLLLVQDRESRLDAAVHMFWMGFDLAVVWLDADFVVVDARLAKRWQPLLVPRRPARYVLETHVEYLNRYAIGDQLALEEPASA